ncbi:MAG: integration host factor subunit alpha [Proteobacteria bacterium]|nr:MAG: integration host factor subunit alpha [Pseudomonadota bacterium]
MTSTITKAELAAALYEEVGLNKREAKDFVDLFFEKIRQSLEQGNAVKLSGFGGFSIRDKSQRPGRNPKTGEEVAVSARRVVTFKASQKLKDDVAVNVENISRFLASQDGSR